MWKYGPGMYDFEFHFMKTFYWEDFEQPQRNFNFCTFLKK